MSGRSTPSIVNGPTPTLGIATGGDVASDGPSAPAVGLAGDVADRGADLRRAAEDGGGVGCFLLLRLLPEGALRLCVASAVALPTLALNIATSAASCVVPEDFRRLSALAGGASGFGGDALALAGGAGGVVGSDLPIVDRVAVLGIGGLGGRAALSSARMGEVEATDWSALACSLDSGEVASADVGAGVTTGTGVSANGLFRAPSSEPRRPDGGLGRLGRRLAPPGFSVISCCLRACNGLDFPPAAAVAVGGFSFNSPGLDGPSPAAATAAAGCGSPAGVMVMTSSAFGWTVESPSRKLVASLACESK